MQSTGAALPVVEAQANLVASYFSGDYALPSPAEQARAVVRDRRAAVRRWGASSRPMMRIDFDGYLAQLAHERAAGSRRRSRSSDATTHAALSKEAVHER